jgi:hypothetical protein
MNDRSTVVRRAARLRAALRRLGGGYLIYHGVVAGLMVVLFFVDTRPGYWREPGALAELALTILLYPLAIPALITCGGLHNCGGSPLTVLAVPVLLLTLVAAGSGIWLTFDLLRRKRRA